MLNLTNLGDADDFQVSGNSTTGGIVLHFKNDAKQLAVGLSVPPTMAASLVEHLVKCLASSPNKDARAAAQIVGIRDLSAQTPHPNLLTLKYELELGVQLETTIEVDVARRLRDQLDKAIQSLESQPPPVRQ